MSRSRLMRLVLAATLATTLLLTTVLPSSSQVPAVPELTDLVDEADISDGLSALDPVLDTVADVIVALTGLLADLGLPTSVNSISLGGDDAVDAAVAFSRATFPDGAGTAILGRSDLFADAFSSGGFQGVNDAPLLLTESGDLDRRTGEELQRLGMENITILGGESALNPVVVQKLEIAGLNVQRVGGPTRIETAVAAASLTNPTSTTAVLTRAYPDSGQPDSQAYADLLAAAPYAAENGWPILQTTSDALHPAVADALAGGFAQAGPVTDVVIIGGIGAVSQAVEDQVADLGIDVRRVAGDNRAATAVAIANERGFASSADADRLILAEGGGRDDVWAPGFASAAHSEAFSAPVLLTDGVVIPPETLLFIVEGLADNLLDGGPAVVCASFVDPIVCEAIGALMIGDINALLDLLGLSLDDLPLLGDLLAALGLEGLLGGDIGSLLEGLGAVLPADADGIALLGPVAEAIVGGDADALTAALEGVAGAHGTDLTGAVLGGSLVPADGPSADVLASVLAVLAEAQALPDDLQDVVDQVLAAGGSANDIAELLGGLVDGDSDVIDAVLGGLPEADAESVGGVIDDLAGGLLAP